MHSPATRASLRIATTTLTLGSALTAPRTLPSVGLAPAAPRVEAGAFLLVAVTRVPEERLAEGAAPPQLDLLLGLPRGNSVLGKNRAELRDLNVEGDVRRQPLVLAVVPDQVQAFRN